MFQLCIILDVHMISTYFTGHNEIPRNSHAMEFDTKAKYLYIFLTWNEIKKILKYLLKYRGYET